MLEIRDTAQTICRGVTRALTQRGFATLAEVSFADGRRADVLALGRDGSLVIVEVKSSVADFRSDRKWPDYRQWCDQLYFAVAEGFPQELIPHVRTVFAERQVRERDISGRVMPGGVYFDGITSVPVGPTSSSSASRTASGLAPPPRIAR